jgi:bifunctional DNA-binding transcriptional regulator/antitoxin component of YhaV-PrlF toxin-antitoxin module
LVTGNAFQGAMPMSSEIRRIKVSEKRQITIPIKFFQQLDIQDEVEVYIENGQLIIQPTRHADRGFAAEILKDLIAQGYQGQLLYDEFVRLQAEIRPAVERLIADVDEYAKGVLADPTRPKTAAEIFAELEG